MLMDRKKVLSIIGNSNWKAFNLFMMDKYVYTRFGKTQFDEKYVEEFCRQLVEGEIDVNYNRRTRQNGKINAVKLFVEKSS
jgi:hypothetical protein